MKEWNNQKTNQSILNKEEIEKIKVFCDYLFYDQGKYYASYPRFVEAIDFIIAEHKHINTLILFKALCGYNKKYLTITRIIRTYINYKEKKHDVLAEIKQFYSSLFKFCLRNSNQFAGREVNETTYSTGCQSNRKITKLIIFRDEDLKVQGLKIEYNDLFECNLYQEYTNKNLYNCLTLSLDYLNDMKVNDGITHVFGTYTDKIEYIGFKCRSGKMLSYGTIKGEPFLFGEYQKELIGIKVKFDCHGLSYIQPSFAAFGISNKYIDSINISKLNDEIIFEEKLFDNQKPIDDSIIFASFVNDYNQDNQSLVNYHNELITPIESKTINKQTIIKEALEYFYSKSELIQLCQSTPLKKNNISLAINDWEGTTIKSTSLNTFLFNYNNFHTIINKMRYEIEREISKEILKYDYDQDFDFYDEYLLKYKMLDPFPLSPKHFDNYKTIKDIEVDFLSYNHIMNTEESQRCQLFYIKDSDSLPSESQCILLWKKMKHKQCVKYTIRLFKLIMCLIQSIKILQSIEDGFYDEVYSLEQKIIFYKELVNNRMILNNLTNDIQQESQRVQTKLIYQLFDTKTENINDDLTLDSYLNINYKLILIKRLLDNQNNHALSAPLALLYTKYIKLRLNLIKRLNKQERKSDIDKLEQKFDCDKIKEDIIKEQIQVNYNESILLCSGDIKLDSLLVLDLENITIYKKQNITDDTDFNDLLFPSTNVSLGKNKIKLWEKVDWKKIDFIIYSNNYEIISLNSIDNTIQSGLCKTNYFQIALLSLVRYPSFIIRLFPKIHKSLHGQYGVYLRINGQWELVLIDDYFPCLSDSKGIQYFSFTSLTKSQQIWPQLIEKAFAKIYGSYANIMNKTVKDICDLLTNTITQKISLSIVLKDTILKTLRQELHDGSILIAKANNFSFTIGLIPDYDYILESIKDISVGGLPEILLKLSNQFGCLKYSGNWSNNSSKWIPSLKHEQLKNDNEFYISLDDFFIHFSVIYLCPIRLTETNNEYIYSNIHYPNTESNPIITELIISQRTKVEIQFHPKSNFDEANETINEVPSFFMLTDENFNYLDSASGIIQAFSINVELEKGQYYIYSDSFSRYIANSYFNGYTISTYSDIEVLLTKITKDIQPIHLFNQAFSGYCSNRFLPKNYVFGLSVYESDKLSTKIPFLFTLFKNVGEFINEVKLTVNDAFDNIQSFSFYCMNKGAQDYENEITRLINKEESLLLITVCLNPKALLSQSYSINNNLSEMDIENFIMSNGLKEQLDEDNILSQYMMECYGGYYVLIYNNSEEDILKMKLILKGLSCNNIKNEILFKLDCQSKKLFKLESIEVNYSGIESFLFQLA